MASMVIFLWLDPAMRCEDLFNFISNERLTWAVEVKHISEPNPFLCIDVFPPHGGRELCAACSVCNAACLLLLNYIDRMTAQRG